MMTDIPLNFLKYSSDPPNSYIFGLHTGRRLFKILFFVFRKSLCIALVCLISLFSLLQEYVVYNIGIIPSGYYKNFTDQDWDGFVHHTIVTAFFIIAIVFVMSTNQYLINVFYVVCRHVLTLNLQDKYFDSNKFYYINTFGYDVTDNPDQRITQDVDKFSDQFSKIISRLVVSPFIIPYYTYICYTTTGWVGPVVIAVCFILSAVINKILIRPVMNMIIRQEKYEGHFRFKHMHVRSNAESIAFQDGKNAELIRAEYHLNNLITVQQNLYLRQYPLNISINLFDYISSIISYLILAQPLFSGKYSHLSAAEIGALVSKNAFISIYLISAFSKLIDLSTSISQIAGLTYRISELLELVNDPDKFPKDISKEDHHEPSGRKMGFAAIELRNVTFSSPSKKSPLVAQLSLDIDLGTNLLITGHSSSGKTSFLRVIKGLWPISAGSIKYRMPMSLSNFYFLPQKALLTDGSLMHQILYPKEVGVFLEHPNNMEQIISYIEYVDLQHVVDKSGGFDVELNWNDILSPGEIQRLSFVRLFYHKPKMVFLDEATSGVSIEMERKIYDKCKSMNITVVTVGHRDSLKEYHDVQLHFEGNGEWTMKDIHGGDS